jgi:hypothetical protein
LLGKVKQSAFPGAFLGSVFFLDQKEEEARKLLFFVGKILVVDVINGQCLLAILFFSEIVYLKCLTNVA